MVVVRVAAETAVVEGAAVTAADTAAAKAAAATAVVLADCPAALMAAYLAMAAAMEAAMAVVVKEGAAMAAAAMAGTVSDRWVCSLEAALAERRYRQHVPSAPGCLPTRPLCSDGLASRHENSCATFS